MKCLYRVLNMVHIEYMLDYILISICFFIALFFIIALLPLYKNRDLKNPREIKGDTLQRPLQPPNDSFSVW